MTAAIDVIHAALEHLGAHSVVNPAGPETLETAVTVLGQVILEWEGEEFYVGATVPTVTASELAENRGARAALEYGLAFKIATRLPKPVPADVRVEGKRVITLARERWQYRRPPPRKRQFIRGQGNGRWR